MTKQERITLDAWAMWAMHFDSEEVDDTLRRAGFDPDDLSAITLEEAHNALLKTGLAGFPLLINPL